MHARDPLGAFRGVRPARDAGAQDRSVDQAGADGGPPILWRRISMRSASEKPNAANLVTE